MSGPGATNYILIDDFAIDCSLRENHTFDSDVTDYPTESGSNISDNIRPMPIVVEIEGLVSNTPIGLMVTERLNDRFKPAETAYLLLQSIRDERKPVTIVTSLRTYDNMAMKSLSIPKGDHQDGMTFQATFQQIQTVENKREIRVSIPIAKGGGGGKGKKSITKPPSPNDYRNICIDVFHNAWWDPDYQSWRHLARFIKVVEQNTGYTTTRAWWHLFRYDLMPALRNVNPLFGVSDLEVQTNVAAPTASYNGDRPYKQLILVAQNQCVLHDFTIKTVPGAAIGPSTLRNRSS